MSINYSYLKESETQIFNQFSEFAEHMLSSWKILHKKLMEKKPDEKFLEQIYLLEDRANHYEAEILDECMWFISKNQPVANHLRFVIAIIKSINDIERMSDYVASIAKFFVEKNHLINHQMYDLVNDIMSASIKASESILSLIEETNGSSSYDEAEEIHEVFQKKYQESMPVIAKIFKSIDENEIAKILNGSVICLKNIEKNVDHALNVAENFIFIKESNFFFGKKSKLLKK